MLTKLALLEIRYQFTGLILLELRLQDLFVCF